MKTEPTDTQTFESTLTGNVHKMGFDENAAAHLMNVLTDLYNDRAMAVIREYSTNARDSHIEAGLGNTPIEIDLPGALSPYIKIRDFGVGMSEDDIRDIYSKYGASTKRETNEQTGMLGLGCKSALTYTNQFTLVGTKDGIRTAVSISRDDTGGSMTVVSKKETDEENGVEVIIPVSYADEMNRKARFFFSFWDAGTVKINGTLNSGPKEQFPNALWIDDNHFMTSSYANEIHLEDDYVVMGGVPYPTSLKTSNLKYGIKTVAFVDIGKVNFTPSREALIDTSKTKSTLRQEALIFSNQEAVLKALQKTIDACETKSEAVTKAITLYESFYKGAANLPDKLTYRGISLPPKLTLPDNIGHGYQSGSVKIDFTLNTPTYRTNNSYYGARKFELDVAASNRAYTLFVYTGDEVVEKLSSYTCRKIAAIINDEVWPDAATFYFIPNSALTKDLKSQLEWFPDERKVQWQPVVDYRFPKSPGNRTFKEKKGSFQQLAPSYKEKGLDELDENKDVIIVAGSERKGNSILPEELDAIKEVYPDGNYSLLKIPSNRKAKFDREWSGAVVSEETVFRKAIDAWKKKIPKTTYVAYRVDELSCYEIIVHMDPQKVKDPKLKNLITIAASVDSTDFTALRDRNSLPGWDYTTDSVLSPGFTEKLPTVDDPALAYPLLNIFDWRSLEGSNNYPYRVDSKTLDKNLEDLYLYVNSVYEKHTQKN
jgi:hypothetical protein